MAHEFESGVYAKDQAWHGLGTVVDDCLTTVEAFQKSGLDWPEGVEKRALFTSSERSVPGGVASAFDGVRLPVPDRFAIVRNMDNAVLGVVGQEYQTIQNVAMFDFLDTLTVGDGKVARWQSAGSLRGGRHVWALLDLPDSGFTIGKGDRMLPYLLVTNAHDGTAACRVIPTTVRVVCMNTLRAAVAGEFKELTVTIRHSGDVTNKIASAKLALARAGEQFAAFERVAQLLAEKPAGKEDFMAIVEALFPTPAEDASKGQVTRNENNRALLAAAVAEEVKLLPEFAGSSEPSYWTLLNGVTRFVDHARPVQLRGRESAEARFEASLVKGGTEVKAQAWDALARMAGIAR